jgi:hypothetical protein
VSARRFVFAALVLAGVAAPIAAGGAGSDRALVLRCYEAFERALVARDGEAAAALLSEGSLREWERDRRLAQHGSIDEVEALPAGSRLTVLSLRHAAPAFLRREGSPPELVAHAVRAGLADRAAVDTIEIRDVAVRGQRASASVLAVGLPAAGLRLGFVREQGAWKLDLPSSLDSIGRLVAATARATGTNESAVIVSWIAALSGRSVGAEVWQPLARREREGSLPGS